jgi:hypothetical protein
MNRERGRERPAVALSDRGIVNRGLVVRQDRSDREAVRQNGIIR